MTTGWVGLIGLAVALLASGVRPSSAEPYLAVQQGYKCSACHVNPTGGGLRTAFGIAFAENVMPARGLPAAMPVWSGDFGERLRGGGDVRASVRRTQLPNSAAQRESGLDQLRLYANLELLPQRLAVYVDAAVAPGNAQLLEAYGKLSDAATGLYIKAGQFYLPFGWRLQDQTALVREVTGIGMTAPDSGVELGLDRPDWSAQIDVSRNMANADSGFGNRVTGQLVWVRSLFRVGSAASYLRSSAGERHLAGVFAGFRSGAVAWLGEADLVLDSGFPEGTRSMAVGLAEADWALRKGHNLKFTAEYFDPDRAVREDQKTRWSLLYEWTPIPFVQLRVGFRRLRGIPQNDFDNRHALFVEIHGFL